MKVFVILSFSVFVFNLFNVKPKVMSLRAKKRWFHFMRQKFLSFLIFN